MIGFGSIKDGRKHTMKFINSSFSLFYKANLLLTSILFVMFLQYNTDYTFITFSITFLGAVSSAVILYILLYILLILFLFIHRVLFYLSGFIFVVVNLGLIVDFFIFRLYKFHINAMVINILTSPDALDSIQLGTAPVVLFFGLIAAFVGFELFIMRKLLKLDEEFKVKLNKKLNKMIILPLFLIVLTEKITYGLSSLFSKNEIVSKFKVIPLYQPLTFSRVAAKYFGYKPKKEAQNIISTTKDLNYPLKPIELIDKPNKVNIFIFVSDAVRNSAINQEITPNIEKFKKHSLVFNNHYSGGNATRFGIFSLLYGMNSTYWFSFLNVNKGPVLFDVLHKLDYQINITSSTNTSWPEFRKTCYVNVQECIKDDFKGVPYQNDSKTSKYFIEWVHKVNKNKPIFSFVFLDAPHGYSYPKEFDKFKAGDEEINYLTVSKSGKDIKKVFSQYKNSIYFNDKLFADMINTLKENGLYENSLIIYTSDHGQEFYEYGYFGHNSAFSRAQTNSPLIIKLPKSYNMPPRTYNYLTSHNDIVPTLLSYIGVKNDPSDYSNGFNLFDKNYKRDFVFNANWNTNAIITNDFTYVFSNIPNKMFKNEVRETTSYKQVDPKNHKANSKLILDIINSNRRFLK